MNCDKFPVHSANSICIDKKLQSNALPGSGQTELDNSIFNLGNIPIEENKHLSSSNDHRQSKDNHHKITGTVFDLFAEQDNTEDNYESNESSKKRKTNKRIKSNQKTNHKSIDEFNFNVQTTKPESNGTLISPNCKCDCRPPFLTIQNYNDKRYFNQIVTGGQMNCAFSCSSHPYFSATEQKIALFWILSFSIVCSICTLIILLTFISDTKRFQYPERCIIFLSACFLMVSIGFLLRIYVGHANVACDILTSSSNKNEQHQLNRRIAQ